MPDPPSGDGIPARPGPNEKNGFAKNDKMLSGSPGAGAGKALGDHFDEPAFVDPDHVPATAPDLIAVRNETVKHFLNPRLVAAQHFAGTDLVVPVQFAFAGGAADGEQGRAFREIWLESVAGLNDYAQGRSLLEFQGTDVQG
jgi:hypothetical protein